jgi:hypothetical protein
MRLLCYGVLAGLFLALLWPGNPASRALISVTDSVGGTLRGTPLGG